MVSGYQDKFSNKIVIRAIIIALLFAVAGIFVLVYQFSSSAVINLQKGDVAPQAIVAPNQITYTSQIETDAARARAGALVPTEFTAPDPKVARQQVSQLQDIFDYIDTVRADPYASLAEKFEWIDAIPDVRVPDTVIDQILIMDDQDWENTRKESLRLMNSVMRDEIKESQIFAKRRELPNKVALDVPQAQADVIVAITEDLIKPNTFPDQERTEEQRQTAIEAVEPVMVTIEANELIAPAGRVIGDSELERLEALGLNESVFSWIDDLIIPAVLLLITIVVLSFYIYQYTPQILGNGKQMVLLALLLLIGLVTAKLLVPGSATLYYMYPIAALTIMISILIDAQLAFISGVIVGFLAGYMATESPIFTVIYLTISGWTGILAIGRRHRVNSLLWAGLNVGLVNTLLITIFNISTDPMSSANVGRLMLLGMLNGIFSAGLALIGLFAIGNLFGITTSIQLIDLGRPTQPLLRQLLLKAPGTYHHSLMVSNLAEQAAERIGANSLLVRVMAYYHDIGKMQRPYFFIENQPEGMTNVHEKLDPQISAKIIISHVTDGLDLANKYRLPQALKDGIAQHQGTGLVRYFYYQAAEAAKETGATVDEANFRYPGPKPQSRETGILMLADVSETTVRALKPQSAAEIDEIVQKSIAHHLETGQLDECDLTIANLHKIRSAFVDILQGVHHPRIKYPEQIKEEEEKKAMASEASPPAQKPGPQSETGDPAANTPHQPPTLKPLSGRSTSGGLVQQE